MTEKAGPERVGLPKGFESLSERDQATKIFGMVSLIYGRVFLTGDSEEDVGHKIGKKDHYTGLIEDKFQEVNATTLSTMAHRIDQFSDLVTHLPGVKRANVDTAQHDANRGSFISVLNELAYFLKRVKESPEALSAAMSCVDENLEFFRNLETFDSEFSAYGDSMRAREGLHRIENQLTVIREQFGLKA